jgi:hypothetical protein
MLQHQSRCISSITVLFDVGGRTFHPVLVTLPSALPIERPLDDKGSSFLFIFYPDAGAVPLLQRMTWLSRTRLFRPSRADNFQIMSDLHLEISQQYQGFALPPCAPYLVLAGDIGRLCDFEGLLGFIASQCQLFRHVFLILGNHEFFGASRSEGLAAVKKLEHEPLLQDKSTVLNRTRVDVSDTITVLGCTLQSVIPPESRAVFKSKVNDFKKIKDWSVDDHNAEHLLDLE